MHWGSTCKFHHCGSHGDALFEHAHADCKGGVGVREVGGTVDGVADPQVVALHVPCSPASALVSEAQGACGWLISSR